MALPAKIPSYHCWAASAYLERVSGEGVGFLFLPPVGEG